MILDDGPQNVNIDYQNIMPRLCFSSSTIIVVIWLKHFYIVRYKDNLAYEHWHLIFSMSCVFSSVNIFALNYS